jgi:secreted trypsin-like serine protease
MRRWRRSSGSHAAVVFAGWLALWSPAHALVGDAAPAEWTMARPTVLVHIPSRGACSGVVLAQDFVLTAAHCATVPELKTAGFIAGYIAGGLFRLANVREIAAHPKFDSDRKNDLALLKLAKPLPTTFAPAFLSARPVEIGERLIVVGYGVAVQDDGKTADKARMATLLVTGRTSGFVWLTDPAARRDDALFRGAPDDAPNGALGSCSGDSGAPAFFVRGGVPVLVGIVKGGYCGRVTIVVPLALFYDWLMVTARRLGSPLDS